MFSKIKNLFNPPFMSMVDTIEIKKTVQLQLKDLPPFFEYFSNKDVQLQLVHQVGFVRRMDKGLSKNVSVNSNYTSTTILFPEHYELSITDEVQFDFHWHDEQHCSLTFHLHSQLNQTYTVYFYLPFERSVFFADISKNTK